MADVVDFAEARAARGLPGALTPPAFPPPEPPQILEPRTTLVDPGAARTAALRPGDRAVRPIVPAWASDRTTVTATVRWATRYAAHVAAFHALRLPLYAARLVLRSPVGLWRTVAAAWRFLVDYENREDRRAARTAARGDAKVFLKLLEEQRQTIRARTIALGVALVLLVAVVFVATTLLPAAWQVAAAVVVVLMLGVVGRKADGHVLDHAAEKADVPPLTADLITTALSNLGLPAINAALKLDERAIRFPLIVRDGPGFRADIDLPAGATAGEVIDRRSKLASGLRRPLGCVWPEPDPEVHEGRLVLYVADQSLSEATPRPWPLAKSGRVNIFEPIPIGTDQRGRVVEVTLMYASGLIGAVPRMGKTFTMRLLLLAASLDPRTEIHAYNLKGGADLDPLEGVAHAYRSGDDPDDLDYMLRDLRAMQVEMRRRYKAIRALPKDRCPESKVTDEIASDPTLGMHPIIAAFDETQVMFEHAAYGSEYEAIVTDLVKRGPAVGIMVWLATQRPDAKSIPTGISSNAVLRLCLKVMGQVENDMVLGTSSYKQGTRATMFSRKDLGIAILVGEGADPVIVRTSYVDGPAAEEIAERAQAARLAVGRLSGVAAGDVERDTDSGTVLDHLLAVWPADDADWPTGRMWCEELATRLAAARPALYAGWTAARVSAAVKPHDVTSVQVKRRVDGRDLNRRGLIRDDLVAATQR